MKKKLFLFLLSGFMLLQYNSVFAEVLRPDASAFPNRTIIIGTYAIVIDHMTNSILEKAENSAQAENQNHIYYKSDINAGTWYDITQSTDISEISKTMDNIVSYEQINSLNLTHYTNEKGQTIDLTTGEQTNTSEIGDVAYPQNMTELKGIEEELKIQKTLKEQGDKEGTKCCDSIQSVIESLYTEKTPFLQQLQDFDKQLQNIENFIVNLRAEGASLEKINEATKQKTAMENQRKALCYQKVLERLESEMTKLDYNANTALIAKYAEYITNVQTTLPTLEPMQASETSSQLQKMLLKAEQSFQKAAGEGIQKGADTGLEKILSIKAAMLGEQPKTEQQKKQQSETLKEAKQQAEQMIQELSKNGCQTKEYQKAKQNGEPESVLQQKQTQALLSLNVALDDVTICLEQMEKFFEPEEMIAYYEQSIENIQNAVDQFDENSAISEQVKASLQNTKNDFEKKKTILQLNGMEQYQMAKQQKQQSQQQAEQKQQQYLSAAENGQTELLESTKRERNDAIEKMQQAEQYMEQMETELQQNNDMTDDNQNTNQNTERSENQNTEQSENQNTNAEEEKQHTAKQQNTEIKVERQDNYTEQEKAEILNVIQQLQLQQKMTFLEPWHIVFQDYDVKLLSPICVIEQQIYVPAQELARQIGAKVYKGNINGDYILKDNGVLIQYYLGEQTIFVNGEEVNVSIAPVVYHNRAYLPLSIFEKAYGMEHIQNESDIIVYKI